MISTTARPTLPVWPTVREAFASVLANWQAVLRIFWAWGVILCVLHVTNLIALLYAGELPFSTIVVGALVRVVVAAMALASTAVAWHRLTLLGERPPPIYLRIGGQVPRYIGRLLLIALTAIPIQLLCSLLVLPTIGNLVRPSPDSLSSAGSLLALNLMGLLISLPAILVTIRLSVSLPGVAVGRIMTLEGAWQLTRGNTLRMCGSTLLFYLPSYVIGIGVGLMPASVSGSLPALLLLIGVSALSTIAAISFLSLSYRFLTSAPQLAQPQAG